MGNLPQGATETGVFTAPSGSSLPSVPKKAAGVEGKVFFPISFTLPTATAPEFVAVKGAEDKSAQGCDGLVSGVPTADEGKLCVYYAPGAPALFVASATLGIRNPATNSAAPGATSRSGAILEVLCASEVSDCLAHGVWAVTGN